MPVNKKAVQVEEELAKMEEELANLPEQEELQQSEEQPFDEDSPPSEEKAAEETSSNTNANEVAQELTEDEISLLSEKAQKRYREMAQRIKELEGRGGKAEPAKQSPVVDLTDNEFPVSSVEVDADVVSPTNLPWDTRTETPSIDLETYKRHVADAAKNVVEQVLSAKEDAKRRQAIYNSFKEDLNRVRETYPELNDIEAGPRYNEDLARKVATYYKPVFEEYKSKGKYYSFDAFVKDWMSVKEAGRSEGEDYVRSTVERQGGEQAFRPSSETIEESSDFSKRLKSVKTIEELEALESAIR